jgi:putative endonuclease
MYYVYILRSIGNPEKTYVGFTTDITQRLQIHNNGESVYTSRYKPWALLSYITFQEESKAIAFERYLKSGSGKAFAQKHFL